MIESDDCNNRSWSNMKHQIASSLRMPFPMKTESIQQASTAKPSPSLLSNQDIKCAPLLRRPFRRRRSTGGLFFLSEKRASSNDQNLKINRYGSNNILSDDDGDDDDVNYNNEEWGNCYRYPSADSSSWANRSWASGMILLEDDSPYKQCNMHDPTQLRKYHSAIADAAKQQAVKEDKKETSLATGAGAAATSRSLSSSFSNLLSVPNFFTRRNNKPSSSSILSSIETDEVPHSQPLSLNSNDSFSFTSSHHQEDLANVILPATRQQLQHCLSITKKRSSTNTLNASLTSIDSPQMSGNEQIFPVEKAADKTSATPDIDKIIVPKNYNPEEILVDFPSAMSHPRNNSCDKSDTQDEDDVESNTGVSNNDDDQSLQDFPPSRSISCPVSQNSAELVHVS